jgi:methionyl-tRNA formyltransferase
LKPELLALPRRGAYNMHGSLLPKYRGRAPVNWAVLHGERATGATLHRMVEKPDAGEIIAQQAVPILPDDTAREVFDKVTLAAELALDDILPRLIVGSAPHVMPDLKQGNYFGGRKPEDGRIDWSKTAHEIHNLVRAVAPPYPGAFCDLAGHRLRLLRTMIAPSDMAQGRPAGIFAEKDQLFARCGDGGVVKILSLELDGLSIVPASLPDRLGLNLIPLI